MGRPLSNAFFGSEDGKIAIQFHNGTSAVTGYIVKQMGSTRYQVTADGTTMFVVTLAQTTAEAETLVAGKATIVATLADDSEVFVKNLQNFTAWTTEGLVINWNNANNVNAATLGTVGDEPEPTLSSLTIDEIDDQTEDVLFTVTGEWYQIPPEQMQYRVGNGTWTACSNLEFGEGTFSFDVTIANPGTGLTITVRDFTGNVGGLTSSASNTFDVASGV